MLPFEEPLLPQKEAFSPDKVQGRLSFFFEGCFEDFADLLQGCFRTFDRPFWQLSLNLRYRPVHGMGVAPETVFSERDNYLHLSPVCSCEDAIERGGYELSI